MKIETGCYRALLSMKGRYLYLCWKPFIINFSSSVSPFFNEQQSINDSSKDDRPFFAAVSIIANKVKLIKITRIASPTLNGFTYLSSLSKKIPCFFSLLKSINLYFTQSEIDFAPSFSV